jgi:hypothetical protein
MTEPNMTEATYHYVTFQGVPLHFRLQFPFHPSGGGADYYVLHGNVALEDGAGLYAEVAVHMSQVVKEALAGLGEKEAGAPAINAIRKTTDTRDMEFLKSTKRQPVHLSSRMFSMVTHKFTFQNANDDQLADFLKSKAYWAKKLGEPNTWVTDPVEQLYLNADANRLLAVAGKLAATGLITLNGERATATEALMAMAAEIEGRMQKALAELNAKHAFERETQKA